MKLRRKILFSFTMLTIILSVLVLFILEAAHLAGGSFQPEERASPIAPGLLQVAITLAVGITVIASILFWTIRRLVLDPIDEIIQTAARLSEGEEAYIRTINRKDEIGQLAIAFNLMAENIVEYRQHLEEKVRAASEKIERTQRDLAFAERLAATGRLAAGVAHEINNPLGGVMNAVARLRREDTSPERAAKYLDICDDGLRRIQETVRRILDFSRKRPEVGPVKVTQPLMQSLDLVRHLLDKGNIRLAVNIEDDQGHADHLRVIADPGDLQHVFLNLLANAVDAMPAGGQLTVNVSQTHKWILVEIIDTGVGLTIEELSASFDYFHTTKPVGKGTGLGLPIAHHIVVGYNGALTLNSQKGVGTRATVELPVIGSRGTNFGRSKTRTIVKTRSSRANRSLPGITGDKP